MFSCPDENEPTTLTTKTFIILSLRGIAERSSLAGINPKSYHLIAFELVNPLLYIYFPSFWYRISLKDLKSEVLPRLRNHNATDDGNINFRYFRKILRSRLGKLM